MDTIYEEAPATHRAELRLLSSIYHKPELLDTEGLDNIFLHSHAKAVIQGIKKIRDSGTNLTIDELLLTSSAYDPSVDKEFLNLVTSMDHTDNLTNVLARLRDTKKVADLKEKFDNTIAIINSKGLEDPEQRKEILANLVELPSIVSNEGDEKKVYEFKEWFEIYEPELKLRASGKRFKFNNQVLDYLVPAGPTPGNGGLVCAATGQGKSALVLNIVNNLIDYEIPTFYFSLEMGAFDTLDRLIAIRTGIPFEKLTNPSDPMDQIAIKKVVEEQKIELTEKHNFRFCESASMTLADCKREIEKFQTEIGQRYVVVVFDLLSMIKDFGGTRNGANFAQIAELSVDKLNAMAKELGIHWIGVLQLGRSADEGKINNVDDVENTKPGRNDIKNSNAYLERSRYAVSLWRPMAYAKASGLLPEEYETKYPEDIIHLQLLKASNSELKGGKLLFDGPTFQCSVLEEED
jgi:replicative DNA helicase